MVLDLPFQPLCGQDCAGLCVECGVNLNDDPGHTQAAYAIRVGAPRSLEAPGLAKPTMLSKNQ